MNTARMTVVQCRDDGVSPDIRPTDILRAHGATATFNLNAGLHDRQPRAQWGELPELFAAGSGS